MAQMHEGKVPFGKFETYYKIFGEGEEDGRYPLVVLHGGPGMMHNYLLSLAPLADFGRRIIFYDQLGCGNSPADLPDDAWSEDLWCDELDNLREQLGLDEIHILGQSCGGMLAQHYMLFHGIPQGVKSVILASTMPSMKIWGEEGERYRSYLSLEMQCEIDKALKTGDLSSNLFNAAVDEYYKRHVVRLDPKPDFVAWSFDNAARTYELMQGCCEFDISGNLRDWDATDDLWRIQVPTLLIHGNDDESSPFINKMMFDRIPDCQWKIIQHGTHLCNAEFPGEYNTAVRNFLEGVEAR